LVVSPDGGTHVADPHRTLTMNRFGWGLLKLPVADAIDVRAVVE
jgi:hypothetical protein